MKRFRSVEFELIEFPSREIGLEICVSCGEGTNVSINTHVKDRNYHVEGAGQLHKECYEALYGISSFEETREFLEKVRSAKKGEVVYVLPDFYRTGILGHKGGLN